MNVKCKMLNVKCKTLTAPEGRYVGSPGATRGFREWARELNPEGVAPVATHPLEYLRPKRQTGFIYQITPQAGNLFGYCGQTNKEG
jgi:hypothetical protein